MKRIAERPIRLAFSTLACPDWNLEQIADAASRLGYAGVELRCLGGEIDLLRRPEMQPAELDRSRAVLAGRGLEVCCVDSGCGFHAIDAEVRRRSVEDAVRHAELAHALGAPLVRVLPNEVPSGATRDETRDRIVASLRELAGRIPSGVAIGLETHGDFATGAATAEIVALVSRSNVGIVWDAGNTIASGESVATAAAAVAPHLLHVHLKDARPVHGERHWRPVLAGQGLVPFGEVIEALLALGYRGWVSFEWEKYWHREIEEPEVALADFRQAMLRVDGCA